MGLNFGANVFSIVDKAVGVANTTNKLDELAVAKGRGELNSLTPIRVRARMTKLAVVLFE
jgi:hypothetical protein